VIIIKVACVNYHAKITIPLRNKKKELMYGIIIHITLIIIALSFCRLNLRFVVYTVFGLALPPQMF